MGEGRVGGSCVHGREGWGWRGCGEWREREAVFCLGREEGGRRCIPGWERERRERKRRAAATRPLLDLSFYVPFSSSSHYELFCLIALCGYVVLLSAGFLLRWLLTLSPLLCSLPSLSLHAVPFLAPSLFLLVSSLPPFSLISLSFFLSIFLQLFPLLMFILPVPYLSPFIPPSFFFILSPFFLYKWVDLFLFSPPFYILFPFSLKSFHAFIPFYLIRYFIFQFFFLFSFLFLYSSSFSLFLSCISLHLFFFPSLNHLLLPSFFHQPSHICFPPTFNCIHLRSFSPSNHWLHSSLLPCFSFPSTFPLIFPALPRPGRRQPTVYDQLRDR